MLICRTFPSPEPSGNLEVILHSSLPQPSQASANRSLILTLEGDMKASFGDYIIKGVNGEFYPCKPDIFEKTYESIE